MRSTLPRRAAAMRITIQAFMDASPGPGVFGVFRSLSDEFDSCSRLDASARRRCSSHRQRRAPPPAAARRPSPAASPVAPLPGSSAAPEPETARLSPLLTSDCQWRSQAPPATPVTFAASPRPNPRLARRLVLTTAIGADVVWPHGLVCGRRFAANFGAAPRRWAKTLVDAARRARASTAWTGIGARAHGASLAPASTCCCRFRAARRAGRSSGGGRN